MSDHVETILDRSQLGFERIASGKDQLVSWQEECGFARQAIVKSAKLMECVPDTVRDAIINVAAVGLTLNPAYGYAYLVPVARNLGTTKNPNWVQECHLRISYKGIINAVTSSGAIQWVAADVVHKNDGFIFRGKWEKPLHEMDPFAEDRGKPTGVYCTVRTHDGQHITETAPWSEVLKAKAAATTSYVWDKWEGEMAKKFIIKRASKLWPRMDSTKRVENVVAVLNQTEGSEELADKIDQTAGYILEHWHLDEGPDMDSIAEAYAELDEQERHAIFTAKSKGGPFDHTMRGELRSALAAHHKEKRGETIE